MNDQRRIRVLLNCRSGPASIEPDELCRLFTSHGCACEVTVLELNPDLKALARSDDEAVIWIAAGGDGTVNTVAALVAGTPRAMGVLPLGTLNHFAQDLHMPMQLEPAIAAIAAGAVKICDAAEVNGVRFVNNSGLGVYPAMVLDRERMKKSGWSKWGSTVVACVRALLRFRCLGVELELHGVVRRCTTPLLFVGNNAYKIDGGRLGRRERLDEGMLSLFLVPHATRAGMLRLLLAALIGRLRNDSKLEAFTVTSVSVRADRRRLRVAFDGEVKRMPPPLHYRTLPGALRVIAPAEASS